MDREKDFIEFTGFMAMLGECTPQGQPSPEKIEMYFQALQDLSFDYIKETAKHHIMTNKWFPAICELRNESDEAIELQAQNDYNILEHYADAFLYPGFAEAGMAAIIHKLEKGGRNHLVPVAKRWCAEIVQGSNPSATRAQCIKSLKIEIKNNNVMQLSGTRKKELKQFTKDMLKDIG